MNCITIDLMTNTKHLLRKYILFMIIIKLIFPHIISRKKNTKVLKKKYVRIISYILLFNYTYMSYLLPSNNIIRRYYLSIKVNSRLLYCPNISLPYPSFSVFLYSTRSWYIYVCSSGSTTIIKETKKQHHRSCFFIVYIVHLYDCTYIFFQSFLLNLLVQALEIVYIFLP